MRSRVGLVNIPVERHTYNNFNDLNVCNHFSHFKNKSLNNLSLKSPCLNDLVYFTD